jgi:type II secretory pathway component PulF
VSNQRLWFASPRNWWPLGATSAQRQALLRLIAVAIEEQLPLAPLIENWSHDERGAQRRRVRKLARLLSEGRALVESLELTPGVLSNEALLAIRFDAQSGTRAAAIRELLAREQDELANGLTDSAARLKRTAGYLCVVLPMCLAVAAFTQIKIVPVFAEIYGSFEFPLPGALARSASLGEGVSAKAWLAAGALAALFWWLFATRWGRPARQSLFGPLLRPWRDARLAGVLRSIAIAAGSGRPIPSALSTLARYHYDGVIRRDLLYVRNEVEQGADVWRSMASVKMLTPDEADLFARAQKSGHLAWTMRKLIAAKTARTSRRLEWAAELAMPLAVFALAAVVVFQAFTVFAPLTQIIQGLT